MSARNNVFRDGRVHVQRRQCSTCVFGRRSPVGQERVDEMCALADKGGGCIPCHHTLSGPDQAVCRGYFDRRSSMPLRLAIDMDVVEYVTIDDFES